MKLVPWVLRKLQTRFSCQQVKKHSKVNPPKNRKKASQGITNAKWLIPPSSSSLTFFLVSSSCVSRSVMSNSATLWTVACQAPLSMELSGQEQRVGSQSLLQGMAAPSSSQQWSPRVACKVLAHRSQKRVSRGRCGAERKQVNNGHPWEGQVPSPGGCLTEFLLQTSFFKVPWGKKMNKCGHVTYLEGLPMMKTRDAQLCQVEQMSG